MECKLCLIKSFKKRGWEQLVPVTCNEGCYLNLIWVCLFFACLFCQNKVTSFCWDWKSSYMCRYMRYWTKFPSAGPSTMLEMTAGIIYNLWALFNWKGLLEEERFKGIQLTFDSHYLPSGCWAHEMLIKVHCPWEPIRYSTMRTLLIDHLPHAQVTESGPQFLHL